MGQWKEQTVVKSEGDIKANGKGLYMAALGEVHNLRFREMGKHGW